MTVGFMEYRLAGLDKQLISILYQGHHIRSSSTHSLTYHTVGILIKDHQKGAGYSGL